jgi:multiple sugar transport system ATP-binding protein
MSTPKLELVDLKRVFDNGAAAAVDSINLSIETGETVALLGPSGCGKSTTLNMIVGLDQPTSGDIRIDGRSILKVPAGKRNVGLVFQDYAVFISMTVRQNLAFGLDIRGVAKAEIAKAVEEVAELLDMTDRLDARARDLGGSELQRIAIGRTLVTKPDVLLLDEPLSNLDAVARLAMRRELRRLQNEIGLTIIYVTHDQIEALSLADRIAVMKDGKIVQADKTSSICDTPNHLFVAAFLGSPPMNLIPGRLERRGDGLILRQDAFVLPVRETLPAGAIVTEGQFTLGIKADSIRITPVGTSPLVGQVLFVERRGPEVILTVDVASVHLKAIVPATTSLDVGEKTGLEVDPDSLLFFDAATHYRTDVFPTGVLNS